MDCGGRVLDLSQPQVMAVLNVTPDSFSDGGSLSSAGQLNQQKVLQRVERILAEGASIIDVGGESTRPGATPVPLAEEMDRVLPVVEAISQRFDAVISVDTSSPELMLAAADCGAGLLNDVRALERPGAVTAAVQTGLPVCLMHMQGSPAMMQNNPNYQSVVTEVAQYLSGRAESCMAAGVEPGRIIIDPGFGFGKTAEHNLQLLKQLPQLQDLGFPILVGLSRKSLIGQVLGREVNERLAGSLALALMSVMHGAAIVRVHDVAETVDAIRLYNAMQQSC
ncbi:dihydropteroate synthase [Dasania sp. GY-MA-18]|uniref:Dihydropteroate synthase n=1 Tax=Dasania phycosphaerae TaxID=2950436 RepID=A0A9J6RI53_9GAMM|nr:MULTISPECIES: dihydropteroate synthase [Dasania]MCR8921241.1 dihydropteroate synthase [Dasania sp. GY-MA-18]MCZ0863669.1 dihydropteroate synthase [Dasania phycosphaerae]MCZ0867397.1 dihydropteroate synthase [Dasania phycosphaerae]